MIKIRSRIGRTYEFIKESSPYTGFAEVILDGCSEWTVKYSGAKVECGTDVTPDTSVHVQGWLGVSELVLKYLTREPIQRVISKLENRRNPGEFLEELVHS